MRQSSRNRREGAGVNLGLVGVRQVHGERFVGPAVLQAAQGVDGVAADGTGAEAVDGLGREHDEFAAGEGGAGFANPLAAGGGVGDGDGACFHAISPLLYKDVRNAQRLSSLP